MGVAGKPNAGKSTLVNAIVGEKLAIVTPKPQTTRDRIFGIHSSDAWQAIFVDMPGLIVPGDRFNTALMEIAGEALAAVDLCYHLVDVRDPDPFPPEIQTPIAALKVPRFLVWTHCDLLARHQQPPAAPDAVRALYRGAYAVSGTKGYGIATLLTETLPLLPEGPALYPVEDLTDRHLRFLVAEMVREKVFLNSEEEVPYGVACEVEEYREQELRPDYIRVTIHVEKPGHKRIIIGAGGAVLKTIGSEARAEIEKLTGKRVFLDLWVKVRQNWRKSDRDLKYFGYTVEKERKRT